MASPRRTTLRRLVRDEELAAEYTRFSTLDQGSTAEQKAINHEIAAEEGIKIVASFKDEGLSRSLAERPGLMEVFQYFEANPQVGFLIVNELERLTAGVGQRQAITALCKRLGITIVTEDMGRIDPHDEDKMFEADQRAVAAKGEVLKVRRRVRRNLRAKVRAGSTVALRPPYGIRMKPLVLPDGTVLPSGVAMLDGAGRKKRSGEIEIHPDEHPWLLKIFEWANEGLSSDMIARRLNDQGVPTKRGKIGGWRGNTINGILDNPLYKGEMTWGLQETLRDENGRKYLEVRPEDDPGRITFASPLGAVVDVALWEQVQARRLTKRNERNMRKRHYEPQAFDNIVYCDRCGHKMYARNDNPKQKDGKVSWRYFCYSYRPGHDIIPEYGRLCSSTQSMLYRNMLTILAGGSPRGRKAWKFTVTRGGGNGEGLEVQRRQLAQEKKAAEDRFENAKEMRKEGFISLDELRAEKTVLDEKLVDIQGRLDQLGSASAFQTVPLTDEVRDTFKRFVSLVGDEALPLEDRLEALRHFGVERLYVDAPNLRLHLRD
jgi:DNA invertase Pin-like site-specific DNA recombinase